MKIDRIITIPASRLQIGDTLIEAERPLSRVALRKDHKDVVVWREQDEEEPWDILPQDKKVTVMRIGDPDLDILRDIIAEHLHSTADPNWPKRWGHTELPEHTRHFYLDRAKIIVDQWLQRSRYQS